MPFEPEKKIEPLLGAYAARRRDAAGAGGPVPPAVRQAWRAEVRRRRSEGASASKPGLDSRPWTQVLASLWPRLAMAGGLAFVLAATVWALVPRSQMAFRVASAPPASAKPAAPGPGLTLADSVQPSSEAARPGSPTARPGSPTSAAAPTAVAKALPPAPATANGGGNRNQPSREERPVELGLTRYSAAAAPPASVLPEPPSPQATPIATPAPMTTAPLRSAARRPEAKTDTAVRPSPVSRAAELAAADTKLTMAMDAVRPPATPPSRPSLAAPPSQPTPAPASRGGMEANPGAVQFFRNVPSARFAVAGGIAGAAESEAESDTRQRRGFLTKAAPPSGGQVLANFTVEQSGSSVRLIDADGSIYEGRIVASPATQSQPTAQTRQRRNVETGPRQRQAQDQMTDRGGGAMASAISTNTIPGTVAFEAIGTNSTLRQSVRLTGEFHLESGAFNHEASVIPTGAGAPGMNQLKISRPTSPEQSARPGQAPQTLGGRAQALSEPTSQFNGGPSQIRRITGQARFGRTNAIAIDAVPDPR